MRRVIVSFWLVSVNLGGERVVLRAVEAALQGPDFFAEHAGAQLAHGGLHLVHARIQQVDPVQHLGHSDAIVTENQQAADYFTQNVDSAAVYVNVSTRFTDGGQFGLGCELGISTQKMHARGPMGLREMNTYKYIIKGDGQVRN